MIYLFAIVFGIGLGGDYMIIPLMAAELFGVKVMGRLMGVVLTADGVAEAVVPMLVGKLRDQTPSYTVGFSVLGWHSRCWVRLRSVCCRKASAARWPISFSVHEVMYQPAGNGWLVSHELIASKSQPPVYRELLIDVFRMHD